MSLIPAPIPFLAAARAVALREVRVELRGREGIVRTLLMALGVLLIYQFSFGRSVEFTRGGPALVWSAVFFAGAALVLGNFEREENLGLMPGLALIAADRAALLLGKWAVATALLSACGLVTLAAGALLFSGSLSPVQWALSGVLILLGASGYAGLGLTLSLAARESRGGGAAAAILLPLLMPLFIALTQAQQALFLDGGFANARLWLGVVLVFNALFVAGPALLAEQLLQD